MDIIVCGDRGQLQQIVSNLTANALKFTEKGSICLRAEYYDGELRFSVQDTGCGMDCKDTERIFTAFGLEPVRNRYFTALPIMQMRVLQRRCS